MVVCIDKILERMDKERAKRTIICPYCSAVQSNDDYTYPVTYCGEDGETEYDCDKCGKTFIVIENVERTYETKPIENEGDKE